MNVLVVSPHPDDETLGAGGTILGLIEQGHKVYWLNITDCQELDIPDEDKRKRTRLIERISELYGFENSFNLRWPTTKLDTLKDAESVSEISKIISATMPEWIILPDYNDVHSDHRKVFDWCFSCTKVFRYPFIKKILTMEIISETNFALPEHTFCPNMFVDISKYMEEKIAIARMYDTEMGIHPFPRSVDSIRALATMRGAMAGVTYAEAFKVLKEII